MLDVTLSQLWLFVAIISSSYLYPPHCEKSILLGIDLNSVWRQHFNIHRSQPFTSKSFQFPPSSPWPFSLSLSLSLSLSPHAHARTSSYEQEHTRTHPLTQTPTHNHLHPPLEASKHKNRHWKSNKVTETVVRRCGDDVVYNWNLNETSRS